MYVEPAEANLQPHIVCIERLWEDSAGKENSRVKLILLSFQFYIFSSVDVTSFICRTVWTSEYFFLLFLSCFFLKDITNRKFLEQHVLLLVFIPAYPQIVNLAGMGF